MNIIFMLLWLVRKSKLFLLPTLFLLISFFVFDSFYKIESRDNPSKVESQLELLSYNVWGFNKNEWIKEANIGDKIIDFIQKVDPDILCLQEHSRIRYKQLTQFPYRSETPYSTNKTVQAIFSKYPIIHSGSLDLPNTINNAIFADIIRNGDTIRIYNVHLQSYSIVPSTSLITDDNKTKKTFKQIAKTLHIQQEQASIIRNHIDGSSYPIILMGDFNNTQFSNVYRKLRGNLDDSFLEAGSGFGRTYSLKGLPLRIDYIFADDHFQFTGHTNYDVKYSDHYPVKASIRWKSHQ